MVDFKKSWLASRRGNFYVKNKALLSKSYGLKRQSICFTLLFVVSVTSYISTTILRSIIESAASHYRQPVTLTTAHAHIRRGDFQRDWCQISSARLDWKYFMKECAHDAKWQESYHFLNRTDPDQSYITLWDINPAGQFSRIVIKSQTFEGKPQTQGGDAWRVHLTSPSSLAPTVFDLGQGEYEAIFLVYEPGLYMMEVMLDYTLCDGLRDPPQNWFIIGDSQGKNQPQGVLGKDNPYILNPIWSGSPLTIIIPPASKDKNVSMFAPPCSFDCKLMWSGLGRWINKQWKPYVQDKYSNKRPRENSGLLWIYGDSAAKRFYNSIRHKSLCTQIFGQCGYSYSWVYQMENYNLTQKQFLKANLTVAKTQRDDFDFNVSRVLNEISQVLFHPHIDQDGVVILNCGLHFVENTNFTNYQALISGIINLVTQTGEPLPKFKGTLIWKTTTAINRQKYVANHLHSRRFLTYQRVQLYNAYAMDAFCKAGVTVLDVYPLTNSYPEGTGSKRFPNDPVHYEDSVFQSVEDLLVEYYQERPVETLLEY